jgi:hypothetical protein
VAGFAIVMTVLTYSFLGFLSACIASLCLYFYSKRRAREEGRSRRLVVATALAPFLALLWLVAALLIHVLISNKLAHQDCGFSPDPYVTLPNGYTLGGLNTYSGYVKAPGFETDVSFAGPGYVRGIIDLELSNGYFTGTQLDGKTSTFRRFVFDTRTRAFQASDIKGPNHPELQASGDASLDAFAVAQTSVHADANSYWVLYAKYRHHWPNYIPLALIIAGEGAIILWVRRLWTTAPTPVAS